MSFVYAFKSNNSIYMIGDTKVTIDDTNGIDNFIDKRKIVEQYGTLKTIILTDDIALGFAGNNLNHIDKALKTIYESPFNLQNIIDILKKFSLAEKDAPDFILAYRNEQIYLISNGIIEKRENCYVGSFDFFIEIQKRKNNNPINIDILSNIRKAIRDNIDETVGGFCTELYYDIFDKKFIYAEALDSTVTKLRYTPCGSPLMLIDNAENGGFAYDTSPIYNEGIIQYLAVHITQINKTYTYVPMIIVPPCKCQYKYLFLPFDISDRI